MKKKNKTFFDEELRLEKLKRKGDPLLKLKKGVNWNIFKTILNNAFKHEAKGPGGRPRYDLIMMFKILILQRIYNLSDEQMEYQINDRLSFMRFLELGLEDDIPDQNTIWNFREVLIQKNKIKQLFSKFNRHLKEKKLLVNEGSIIDATFVEVPIQRNSKDENKQIKNGKTPDDWNDKKRSHKDTDARWMTKYREKHFGYKDHIKIDIKSKFIKNFDVTSANVHDSQKAADLIEKDDSHHDLFADSAYSGEEINKKLKKHKIRNRIHEKGYRYKKLTEQQKENNTKKSRKRVRVEHVFGFIENSMNGLRLKAIGIKRISGTIGLMNMTYNILRFMQLQQVKYA